jgi:hypothetical protein
MSDLPSQNSSSAEVKPVKVVGRNEPCPCGSGVKYKRCHGVEAPPKLSERKMPDMPAGLGGMPSGMPGSMPGMGAGGFDPSQMDPAMLMQMSQMLQRLPKGQMQKLQAIMTRAMAGKDVTREAQDLERSLPPEFLEMMKGFAGTAMAGMPGIGEGYATPTEVEAQMVAPVSEGAPVQMTAEEARAIVEKAVQDGKVTADQAAGLLEGQASGEHAKKGSFWSRFTGKKN